MRYTSSCLYLVFIEASNYTARSIVELLKIDKKGNAFDQEILQSHTAHKPTAPRGRAT